MNQYVRKYRLRGVTSNRLLAMAILYFVLLLAVVFVCYDYFFAEKRSDFMRESVTVPSVVGQTVDDVAGMLDEEAYRIALHCLYDAEQPAGTVLRQSPAAGMRRKISKRDGERIDVTLTVSLGPRYETVPSLIGTDGRQAQLQLESQGFSVHVIRRTSWGTMGNSDWVIRTEPPAGSTLTAGSTVTLYVSYPQATPSVQCPSLVGMDRMSALAALREVGLSPGEMTVKQDDVSIAPITSITTWWSKDTVLTQSPPAGCWLPEGSQVDLVLQRSPRFEFELTPTPPQKGMAHPWIISPPRPNFTEGSSNA